MKLSLRLRHPGFWQAFLEVIILCVVLLTLLLRMEDSLSHLVLGQGVFFLSAAAALVFAIRLPPSKGSLRRRFWYELGAGIALSLALTGGLRLWSRVVGLDGALFATNWGSNAIAFLLASGPGFWTVRVFLVFWGYWDNLRRRHLVWEITHDLLSLVLFFLALMLFFVITQTILQAKNMFPIDTPVAVSFTARLIRTILPALSISLVLAFGMAVFVMPPAAILSYLMAGRVTRRVDSLAKTARRLMEGDYSARVPQTGQDEIAQLQGDFNQMTAQLELTLADLQRERDKVKTLLEGQRNLIANISHELRTPVATIQGFLEPLIERWEETPPPSLQNDLGVVEREVQQLGRLIDDLFALSQSELGKLTLQPVATDLEPLIRVSVETFAPLAWQRGRVEVLCDLCPPFPAVLIDPGRFEQILSNLLRNAIRHTGPGGLVIVRAEALDTGVQIEVRDTGEGISAQDLPKIWDRFYQINCGERPSDGGAGLGLALVKELTLAMNGQVSAESIPGAGSIFRLWFPAIS